MQRIIYISTARQLLANAALDGILVRSRQRNRVVGVTGLLVAGGRRFLQTLEGPDEAVEATFRRIEQDPRHFAMVVVDRRRIEAPTFGAWAMGFCRGGEGRDGRTLPETVSHLIAPITDPTIRAHFEGFALLHAAA